MYSAACSYRCLRSRHLLPPPAPAPASCLPSQRDANRPHVTATVEGTQADGVLARSQVRDADRVTLVATICNSVVRKHWCPQRTVDTDVGSLHFSGRIYNFKARPRIGPARRVVDCAYDGRRVVYINRLTHTFAGKRLSQRIVRRV